MPEWLKPLEGQGTADREGPPHGVQRPATATGCITFFTTYVPIL